GAGEDAEPLALAAGDEAVERPHPERQPALDPRPAERLGRVGGGAAAAGGREGRAVERPAEGVDDLAEQRLADRHAEGLAFGGHRLAGADPAHLAERHQEGARVAEADHLGGHRLAVAAGFDQADLADLGLQTAGLDDQPDHVADAAAADDQVGAIDRALGRREGAGHWGSDRSATTFAARSNWAEIWASISPALVLTMQPPRSTRRSARTLSSPPCSEFSEASESRTRSTSSGLTSRVAGRGSVSRRRAPRTTSRISSGSASSAP